MVGDAVIGVIQPYLGNVDASGEADKTGHQSYWIQFDVLVFRARLDRIGMEVEQYIPWETEVECIATLSDI